MSIDINYQHISTGNIVYSWWCPKCWDYHYTPCCPYISDNELMGTAGNAIPGKKPLITHIYSIRELLSLNGYSDDVFTSIDKVSDKMKSSQYYKLKSIKDNILGVNQYLQILGIKDRFESVEQYANFINYIVKKCFFECIL